jgi:hypothetical protein
MNEVWYQAGTDLSEMLASCPTTRTFCIGSAITFGFIGIARL